MVSIVKRLIYCGAGINADLKSEVINNLLHLTKRSRSEQFVKTCPCVTEENVFFIFFLILSYITYIDAVWETVWNI